MGRNATSGSHNPKSRLRQVSSPTTTTAAATTASTTTTSTGTTTTSSHGSKKPKKLKPHITDVMRTEKNAVLLWTVTPPQEEQNKVFACLKG